MEANATYRWYVQARNDYAWSPASEEWQFTTAIQKLADTIDTTIVKTYPRENDIFCVFIK